MRIVESFPFPYSSIELRLPAIQIIPGLQLPGKSNKPRRAQTVTIARYFTLLCIYFQSHIGVGVEYEDSRIIPVPILQYIAEVTRY